MPQGRQAHPPRHGVTAPWALHVLRDRPRFAGRSRAAEVPRPGSHLRLAQPHLGVCNLQPTEDDSLRSGDDRPDGRRPAPISRPCPIGAMGSGRRGRGRARPGDDRRAAHAQPPGSRGGATSGTGSIAPSALGVGRSGERLGGGARHAAGGGHQRSLFGRVRRATRLRWRAARPSSAARSQEPARTPACSPFPSSSPSIRSRRGAGRAAASPARWEC